MSKHSPRTPADSIYVHVSNDDAVLPIDIRAWAPSLTAGADISLRMGSQLQWLDLHQVNLLIARLTAARDAYQAALQAQHDEELARCAPLADPDDAAPGHELIERERFTATIRDGAILTVDGRFNQADAVFHQSADADWKLDAISLPDGQALSIGDVVELERIDANSVQLLRVLTPSGQPAINFFELYKQAITPPQDPDERQRFYDDERDADERWDAARIGPGAEQTLFPTDQTREGLARFDQEFGTRLQLIDESGHGAGCSVLIPPARTNTAALTHTHGG